VIGFTEYRDTQIKSAVTAVEELARRFEVSREAARIRLSTLGFLDDQGARAAGLLP